MGSQMAPPGIYPASVHDRQQNRPQYLLSHCLFLNRGHSEHGVCTSQQPGQRKVMLTGGRLHDVLYLLRKGRCRSTQFQRQVATGCMQTLWSFLIKTQVSDISVQSENVTTNCRIQRVQVINDHFRQATIYNDHFRQATIYNDNASKNRF